MSASGEVDGQQGTRSVRRIVIVLGVLMLALIGWIGLRVNRAVGVRKQVAHAQASKVTEQKAQATGPRKVEVVRGEAATWQPTVAFEGTLSAQQEADLGFKVSGRLATTRVKVGDRVRTGQVLATLAADEASAQLAAAQAQVAAAEAQMALAADAEQRTSVVVASGAQSEAVGVQARKQKDLAEAQRDAARAQATLARTSLENHTLRAPFAGTVTRVPPAIGAVVAPGVPLFHLADLGTLKLTGSVRPADAALMKVGSGLELLGDDRTAVVGRGKITAVVPQLDATTRRIPVEATIANNPAAPLLAGTVMRARVTGAKGVPVLKFPHTVLRPGSQDELLVVTAGRLEVRKVDHALASDGSPLVRGGVAANDDVVLVAWPEAADGLPVAVAPTGATAEVKR